MTRISTSLTARVIWLFVAAVSFTSCYGQGTDQVHGMLHVGFPSTAVCQAQQKSIAFRNVSGDEIVIEGVAISGGTDPLGNFAIQSVTIDGVATPSTNGVLQDVHVPSGSAYSFQVSFLPKLENSSQDAVIDIAYKSPKEGIVQVALEGTSAGTVGECSGGGGGGGPVVGFDGDMILTVEKMIAATSALQSPINTDQGKQTFTPVPLPVTLNGSAGTASLPTFTGDGFVLPPPTQAVYDMGLKIKGSINVTIPNGGSGTFDPATGALDIPGVLIHMEGTTDFSGDLTIRLTTGRVARSSITPAANIQALQQLGSPPHYDTVAKEVFGTPIDSATGKVFLVGMATLENIVISPTADNTLSSLPSNNGMAVLIEGTLTKAP